MKTKERYTPPHFEILEVEHEQGYATTGTVEKDDVSDSNATTESYQTTIWK